MGESHQPRKAIAGSLDAHPLLSKFGPSAALNVEHADPLAVSDANARLALTAPIYISHTWFARDADLNGYHNRAGVQR
jgi:hypothetical protein